MQQIREDRGVMDFDVGARLRAIREEKGLSQRQLAIRAGVTNGTISLIEQNRNSPSIASLRKVLQGIPMVAGGIFRQRHAVDGKDRLSRRRTGGADH